MQVFPEMAFIGQNLRPAGISDVRETLDKALKDILPGLVFNKGETVAILAGSRKINRIDEIIAGLSGFLKEIGLCPFIVPAMGSHGGATPEGQAALLSQMGIPGDTGLEIRASMDVEKIGELESKTPVFAAREALKADHIIPVNRIKPHTKFSGPVESGLCKMLSIGLGKEEGAKAYHKAAVNHGFGILFQASEMVLSKCSVLMGIGLVEDSYSKLAVIKPLLGADIPRGDAQLLEAAYKMLARIPFRNIDVLIIDEIGKDISGIGMDSNVTGRHRDISGDFFIDPNPRRIFVRDLSKASQGNANGIGLADFTTTRFVKEMDKEKTFVNSLAAISPEKAAIPMHFDTDEKCIQAALATCGADSFEKARVIRIKNTSKLSVMQVSRAFEKEVDEAENLFFKSDWEGFSWDEDLNLMPFPGFDEE